VTGLRIEIGVAEAGIDRAVADADVRRRAMLPERRTGATLGDTQLRSDLLNAGTATPGAQNFPEQPPAE